MSGSSSFSRQQSKQTSIPFLPLGGKQTRELARRERDIFAPIALGGDFNSPLARMMASKSLQEGKKAEAESLAQLAESHLSSPTKGALFDKISQTAIGTAAGVPMQVWQTALSALDGFFKQLGSMSRGTASGWSGQQSGGISLSQGGGDENA